MTHDEERDKFSGDERSLQAKRELQTCEPAPPLDAKRVAGELAGMSQHARHEFFDALKEHYCLDCGSDAGWGCNCMRDD